MMCIYLRTNLVNGKQYVGQTKDFKQREDRWRCMTHHYAGKLIDNARKKYGFDSFKCEVLKECQTLDELNFWEKYYIEKLNTKTPNGYNLTDGGDGSNGYKHTEEIKRKLSELRKGKTPFNKGKKIEDLFGMEKADWLREKATNNAIPIIQCDLNGNKIREWSCGKEASKELGLGYSNINKCIKGIYKTAFGYIWKKKR